MNKKFLLLLPALLMCCMFAFTSCGDDEKDEPTPTEQEKVITTKVVANYNIEMGADLFKVAKSLNVTYYDKNGDLQTTSITEGTSWKHEVTTEVFPAKWGMKINVVPRDTAEIVTQDSYTIGVKLKADAEYYKLEDENILVHTGTSTTETMLNGLDYDRLSYTRAELLEQLSHMSILTLQVAGTYTKDGVKGGLKM